MRNVLAFICALLASCVARASASDDILIIEQDYSIVEQGKGGLQAKDVRQKIYIHPSFVCIDEFGGKQGQTQPTESILLDLKNKLIIHLDHEFKKIKTETFDERRKRIEARKKQVEDDILAHPNGATKDKLKKLYRALLDDKRCFALAKDPGPAKKALGIDCQPIKIIDATAPDYAPFEAQMHSTLELPYDNTEALYLLQLIGKSMSEFLHVHKDRFKYVPMELHLDLAAGGHLDTKVISVMKMEKINLSSESRGTLGSPFTAPNNYEQVQKTKKPPPKKEDERPD
ncbi:MAG: hypothetical protein V1899_13130 [Planctomycetota bacterium]